MTLGSGIKSGDHVRRLRLTVSAQTAYTRSWASGFVSKISRWNQRAAPLQPPQAGSKRRSRRGTPVSSLNSDLSASTVVKSRRTGAACSSSSAVGRSSICTRDPPPQAPKSVSETTPTATSFDTRPIISSPASGGFSPQPPRVSLAARAISSTSRTISTIPTSAW